LTCVFFISHEIDLVPLIKNLKYSKGFFEQKYLKIDK